MWEVDPVTEPKKSKRILKLRNVLVFEMIVLAVTGMLLFLVETAFTEYNQKANLIRRLDKVTETFNVSYQHTKDLTRMYDGNMQAKADAVAYLVDHDPDFTVNDELMDLFVVDQIMIGYTPEIKDVGFRYYTSTSENGTMICIKKNTADLDQVLNNIYTENRILQKVINSKDLFFVVTNNIGKIVYYPDPEFIGQSISALGIRLTDLVQKDAKWLRINKEQYYTSSVVNEHLGITIACGISARNMTMNSHAAVGIIYVAICIVFTVLITYGYFAKQDFGRFKGERKHELIGLTRRKLITFGVIGLTVIGLTANYVQTLFSLTMYSISANNKIAELSSSIDEASYSSEQLKNVCDINNLNKAQIVAEILSHNPELRTKENLKDLSRIFDLEYIMLFNGDGVETLSDSPIFGFVISDEPEDQSYTFRMLKHGVPYVIQEAQEDELTGTYHQFVGVTMHDANGEYDGFLQTANNVEELENVLKDNEVKYIVSSNMAGENNEVFIISNTDKTITYSSLGDHEEELAVDNGIEDAQIRNKYYGYINFDGERYYAESFQSDDSIIYICENVKTLFTGRLSITLTTVLLSTIGIIAIFIYIYRHDVEPIKIAEEDDPYIDVTVYGGQQKRTLNIISRMLRERVTWEKKTAEEKTAMIVQIVVSILAVFALGAIAFRNVLYTEDSIFGFIMSGKWERGLNVFAYSEVLMVLFVYFMAVAVLKNVFNEAIKLVTPKSETMLRLLSSFVNYLATIFVIFYCLSLLGFDSQSLLASAGILTLVIGLGARDLVTDILAGIFIIFEHEFQVGDIIEINGYKGRVIEIGIRTTRLMSVTQDIKSVNNRNLTNIVNKTKRNSYCDVIINVPFDQDIAAIEEMLRNELPKIKELSPYILDGPNYGGIDDMSGRTMRLSIRTECLESHKFDVRTVVNREIKRLFEENGFKLT